MDEDLSPTKKYGLQIKCKLGGGSFGRVYEALDLSNGSCVAVKVIPKQLMRGCDFEHTIFSQLNHPNIVKFLRVHQSQQNMFIVMEYLEHGNLGQMISRRKLTDQEASLIMMSVLRGVSYLHDQEVIHRDIKPDNIFLGSEDDLRNVKIGDFGLSFQFDKIGNYHKLISKPCGTIIFMAPEQFTMQQYSKPVDIYSCGIIMYMLLSGGNHPLYKSDTKEEYMQKALKPEWQFDEQFSRLAIDFFKKMVCTNTQDRYSAGQALMHPWITRQFQDDIPRTFLENISLFQQKQQLAKVSLFINACKLLKCIMLLSFLKKPLHKPNYKSSIQHKQVLYSHSHHQHQHQIKNLMIPVKLPEDKKTITAKSQRRSMVDNYEPKTLQSSRSAKALTIPSEIRPVMYKGSSTILSFNQPNLQKRNYVSKATRGMTIQRIKTIQDEDDDTVGQNHIRKHCSPRSVNSPNYPRMLPPLELQYTIKHN